MIDYSNFDIYIDNENRTRDIKSIIDDNGFFKISFFNMDKEYSFKKDRVVFFDKKEEINNNVFDYYKEIAQTIGLKLDYDNTYNDSTNSNHSQNSVETSIILSNMEDDIEKAPTTTILGKQYDNINKINVLSVLYHYINGTFSRKKAPETIIYPFGMNQSQKIAVENALSNQVSTIEGPPGTGKTQTILNIIANIIYNDQNVAVVSNNNSAVKNVLDKLKDNNVDFICAFLGSQTNKINFIDKQTGEYPKELKSWKIDNKQKETIISKIKFLTKELNEKLNIKMQISKIDKQIIDYEPELYYYKEHIIGNEIEDIVLGEVQSGKLMKFIIDYEYNYDKNTIFNKIRTLFIYGRLYFRLYRLSKTEVINTLQKIYYETKISELTKEKQKLNILLDSYNFDEIMKELSNLSLILFKDKLSLMQKKNTNDRRKYSLEDLWKDTKSFIKEYPVILSTTYSIRKTLSYKIMFDNLIIDEASQGDLVTGALAFSCSKNAVIVGDLKQLPNVIDSKDIKEIKRIAKKYHIDEKYELIVNNEPNSLLKSSLQVWKNIPHVLLHEHYRCEPKIINFCNEMFYNNELIIMTKKTERRSLLLEITDVDHSVNKHCNNKQIDTIQQVILPELKRQGYRNEDIGIIAPYRDQVAALKSALKTNIEIDTVHKFQGREKDVIIISSVDNEISEFVDNPNLLNVAVSRAKKYLIVLITDNKKNWSTNYGALKRYIEYNNQIIRYSHVSSVFDLLYKDKETEKKEYIKKKRIKDTQIAERLLQDVIDEVLLDDKFIKVKCYNYYALSDLVNDYSCLSIMEKEFISKDSHLDYLFFNSVDKKPICAIELNGVTYHKKGSRQERNDSIKKSIMNKIGIPLLTIWTSQTNCKQIIFDFLFECDI